MSKLLFYPEPCVRCFTGVKNSLRKTCVADTATLKNVDPAFSKNADLNLIHSKKNGSVSYTVLKLLIILFEKYYVYFLKQSVHQCEGRNIFAAIWYCLIRIRGAFKSRIRIRRTLWKTNLLPGKGQTGPLSITQTQIANT